MTPSDVKELLKTLIAEEELPINVIDIAPSLDLRPSDSRVQDRIKDVVHQWNTGGKTYTIPLPHTEFYTKTDAVSPTRELMESLEIETFLESIISEHKLPICIIDQGFKLVTLSEEDKTRYPIKILHGAFRLEKQMGTKVQATHLKNIVECFENELKEKRIKSKLFHRGFNLTKSAKDKVSLSQVKKIAEQISEMLGINYVLNTYKYENREEASETTWNTASICVSLWRFPRG